MPVTDVLGHRVLVVFGTRPEAVKLAPVIERLRQHPSLRPVVVVTGQHRELLNQALTAFAIQPDANLNLLVEGQPLAEQFARALTAISQAINEMRPSLVVVQGDTASACAGAMAAFYAGTPLVHVEAGLRSGRMDDPFPEEGNRKLISVLARLHCAPTCTARDNLLAEGVPNEQIYVTGNTVIDALTGLRGSGVLAQIKSDVPAGDGPLVLVTLHRRENWGRRMGDICRGLRRALERASTARLVLPMHPNPVVRTEVRVHLGDHPRALLTEPLGYPAFVALMSRCQLVLTDSGGVQEEAPALGVPVLVAREATERPEAITAGVARLAGVGEDQVCNAVAELLNDPTALASMTRAVNPFGDGYASERIVAIIANWAGCATTDDRLWLARPWTMGGY